MRRKLGTYINAKQGFSCSFLYIPIGTAKQEHKMPKDKILKVQTMINDIDKYKFSGKILS